MTLYSKGNLEVRKVAHPDPDAGALNTVLLAGDGATVGANGRSFMAVGPVGGGVDFPDVGKMAEVTPAGVCVDLGTVDVAAKNVPKGKVGSKGYKHVGLTRCDVQKVELTTTDGKMEQRVAGTPVNTEYPDYKEVLRGVKERVGSGRPRVLGGSGIVNRVCVSRQHLLSLLEAMHAAADGAVGLGGEEAIWIEFGGSKDSLLLRTTNYKTGQRVIGVAAALDTGGKWLEEDEWEDTVFGAAGGKTPLARKRKTK